MAAFANVDRLAPTGVNRTSSATAYKEFSYRLTNSLGSRFGSSTPPGSATLTIGPGAFDDVVVVSDDLGIPNPILATLTTGQVPVVILQGGHYNVLFDFTNVTGATDGIRFNAMVSSFNAMTGVVTPIPSSALARTITLPDGVDYQLKYDFSANPQGIGLRITNPSAVETIELTLRAVTVIKIGANKSSAGAQGSIFKQ